MEILLVIIGLIFLYLFGIFSLLGMERIAFYVWKIGSASLRQIVDLPPPVIGWGLTGGLIGILMGWTNGLARTPRWGRRPWWIFFLIPIGLLLIGLMAFLEMPSIRGSGSR